MIYNVYTSPGSFSSSTSICRSGLKLGLLLTNRPRTSPSSPDRLPLRDRDGDRETYRPASKDEAEDDRRRLRRSGDDSREDGGVLDGVREVFRGRDVSDRASLAGLSS